MWVTVVFMLLFIDAEVIERWLSEPQMHMSIMIIIISMELSDNTIIKSLKNKNPSRLISYLPMPLSQTIFVC